MRGEHPGWHHLVGRAPGSSPHAWGTLFWSSTMGHFVRFIPTCVGNTSPVLLVLVKPAVHPHMRGEHAPTSLANAQVTGSSPHAWGTRLMIWIWVILMRFIPTCVGNTPSPRQPD